jgi:hypothetical protein
MKTITLHSTIFNIFFDEATMIPIGIIRKTYTRAGLTIVGKIIDKIKKIVKDKVM